MKPVLLLEKILYRTYTYKIKLKYKEKTMIIISLLIHILIAYLGVGFVHELGHAVMGIILKWNFTMLVIGPFGWKYSKDKNRMSFYFEKNIAVWGGMACVIPNKEDEEKNLEDWKRILIAGPVMSILCAILSICIFFLSDSLFMLIFALESLGVGIVCIVPLPIRAGVSYSDGYRFYRLSKRGQGKEEERALLYIATNSFIYFSDFIPERTRIMPMVKSKCNEIQYYGLYYLYLIERNEGNMIEANKIKKRMKEIEKKVSKLVLNDCASIGYE